MECVSLFLCSLSVLSYSNANNDFFFYAMLFHMICCTAEPNKLTIHFILLRFISHNRTRLYHQTLGRSHSYKTRTSVAGLAVLYIGRCYYTLQ